MTTLATTPREQTLNDVFTTALEGGIGYWSTCSKYVWSDGTPDQNAIIDFEAVVHDIEEPEKTYTINATTIRVGIRTAYDHYLPTHDPESYQWRALRDLNFGRPDVDFDADTADKIVQFGLGLLSKDGGPMYG